MMMNYLVAASTDIGLTKKTNQDSYSVRVLNTQTGKMVFAIICDGMGGLDKGEVASATIVNAFCSWADNTLPLICDSEIRDIDIRTNWENIVETYNEKIKLYGDRYGARLGTTVTAILVTDSRYYIVNVGDTRAYEIRESVRVLTKDQTVVAREIENGLLSEEAAKTDPRRSVLLQCVGASPNVYPDFFFGQTLQNAVYMLCSDGFRHEISENEIQDYLHPDAMMTPEVMKANIDQLIEINKLRQERDNISVVAIRTF